MTRPIETSQPGTSNASEQKHQAVSAEDVARVIASYEAEDWREYLDIAQAILARLHQAVTPDASQALSVGDRVRIKTLGKHAPEGVLKAIDGTVAWLDCGGHIGHETRDLDHLERISLPAAPEGV